MGRLRRKLIFPSIYFLSIMDETESVEVITPVERVGSTKAFPILTRPKQSESAKKRLKKIRQLRQELGQPAKQQTEASKRTKKKRIRIHRKPPNQIQPFVKKILDIIESCEYKSIKWHEREKYVFIIDRELFETEFLRQSKEEKAPIQTKNYPSFIRQLNLYGFRKAKDDRDCPSINLYFHKEKLFTRDREDLMAKIVRSGSNTNVDPDGASNGCGLKLAKRGPKTKPKSIKNPFRSEPYGYEPFFMEYPPAPAFIEHTPFPPPQIGLPSPFNPWMIKQENGTYPAPYPGEAPFGNADLFYPGISSDEQTSQASAEVSEASIKKEYVDALKSDSTAQF